MRSGRQGAGNRRQAPSVRTRWLAPLLGVASLAVLLGSLFIVYQYLAQPGRLPLRVIEVNGEFRHLSRDAIRRTVVDTIDGGFFSCDMQKLRVALRAMPWVDDVSIRRIWPDKLSMAVTEQIPLARWGQDALISASAHVFRPASLEGYESLVELSGPQGSEGRVVAFYRTALPAAQNRGLQIRQVRLDARRHWWVQFDRDLTLSLGREDVARRLAQFFRVFPRLAAEPDRKPIRIDMRYEHGFAVRWQARSGDKAASEGEKPQEDV